MSKVIGFVPVRSGSKGIPDKNIKKIWSKPLVYWVIKALSESSSVDVVVVATDSKEYSDIINGFSFLNVKVYMRDQENAQDKSSTESVMLEYISKGGVSDGDYMVLAQATSPLTSSQDIDEAYYQYIKSNKDSLLSCVRIHRFFWEDDGRPLNYDYKNRPRRQDFDGVLVENGALYINKISNIVRDSNRLSGDIGIYEMNEDTFVEIDSDLDFEILSNRFSR